MKVINSVSDFINFRETLHESIGFVPTMGALHQGHQTLINHSLKDCKKTIVSIFVNPTQFNNPDDFTNYPRDYDRDVSSLEKMGVDVVFLPEREEMYPLGEGMLMQDGDENHHLEGANRPGHFDGVLTVVLKLFNIIRPNIAYFGLKDYQQYKLIKDMAQNYFLPIKVRGVDTVRDKEGLALSSRNFRLSESEIKIAQMVAKIFQKPGITLNQIKSELETIQEIKIDYLEDYNKRRFIAYFIRDVRLIDNISLEK